MKEKAGSRTIAGISAAVCLSMAGFSAHADGESLLLEGGDAALLSTIEGFHIKVVEQVADGCLANPAALQEKMDTTLRQKGFHIADRAGSKAKSIVINAMGYQMTSSPVCAVSLKVYIDLPILATVPYATQNISGDTTLIFYHYDVRAELLTGPKSDMQGRLEYAVQEAANSVAVDIAQARETIFTKFPAIKQEFENQEK